MDFATASEISGFFSVAAPILIGAAFVWVIWRTESRHVLIRRLWQLVHGKQEITDPEVRAFVDEQTSLVSFRLFAGIPVASLTEAHQLIQWAKHNDVQMRTLRHCGELFDAELRQVKEHKLPGRASQAARLAGFVAAVAVFALSVASLPTDRALLSLKATGRLFLATATEITAAWPLQTASLSASDCTNIASDIEARTSFSEDEVKALCSVFKDAGFPAFVKSTVKEQRWSAVLLCLFATWLAWLALFAWGAGVAAKKLADRRIDPALPGSQQLTLALDD
ncbi:hypothetical protein CLU95_2959 [Variovorax sp. 54]|uniref:DUF6216 family protein n=1 Tax=Variovorax sp. 54 TaxID=2035212 RepID=UPI000C18E747|nr:DUF6216 family protein [Variovorax sp. 54]PIF75806.1 hypothetical protein CLU95_2959 [Variovorax sp. 54]